ncbi:MAG: TetR family transcriptional regulator, partial [Pseudomonadota bacterium]|nr:TetR family transcriptional regulator [Pseudomonadota bacterium]
LLEAAGVSADGLAGAARVAAMTAVWGRVLQVWRDDEGALNRTMAELDKRLRQMRDRLGRIGAGF